MDEEQETQDEELLGFSPVSVVAETIWYLEEITSWYKTMLASSYGIDVKDLDS